MRPIRTPYGSTIYKPEPTSLLERLDAEAEKALTWILDNIWVVGMVLCLAIGIGIWYGLRQNDQLNKSMIGKPRVTLIVTFGVPDKDTKADYRTEVMEWVKNYPGHADVTSDGKGNVSTNYTDPQTYTRTAILEDGICVKCEGL